jgi:hypothetical protein
MIAGPPGALKAGTAGQPTAGLLAAEIAKVPLITARRPAVLARGSVLYWTPLAVPNWHSVRLGVTCRRLLGGHGLPSLGAALVVRYEAGRYRKSWISAGSVTDGSLRRIVRDPGAAASCLAVASGSNGSTVSS